MKKYLRVNDFSYIDTESWTPVSEYFLKGPFDVECLSFFWDSRLTKSQRKQYNGLKFEFLPFKIYRNKFKSTNTVHLNQLSIEFKRSYEKAEIRYFDKKLGRESVIEIDCWIGALSEDDVLQMQRFPIFTMFGAAVEHHITVDLGGEKERVVALRSAYNHDAAFCSVPLLYGECALGASIWRMSIGLDTNKFRVFMDKTMLDLYVYAFISGPWAVLLTEDFKFDALVELGGIKFVLETDEAAIIIKRVVHSCNPYYVRAAMLAG